MNIFVQAAAEEDILHETERYARLGLPAVAARFQEAVFDAIERTAAMPFAGSPRVFKNPKLTGLRVRSVKGFDDFRVYYLVDAETLTVVRILHGKRDVARILGGADGS